MEHPETIISRLTAIFGSTVLAMIIPFFIRDYHYLLQKSTAGLSVDYISIESRRQGYVWNDLSFHL
jgi:hypothetical protein